MANRHLSLQDADVDSSHLDNRTGQEPRCLGLDQPRGCLAVGDERIGEPDSPSREQDDQDQPPDQNLRQPPPQPHPPLLPPRRPSPPSQAMSLAEPLLRK